MVHASGPPPFYDKRAWMAAKHELLADYDFPNLPYYRVVDKITKIIRDK